jgi:hypothetical protein
MEVVTSRPAWRSRCTAGPSTTARPGYSITSAFPVSSRHQSRRHWAYEFRQFDRSAGWYAGFTWDRPNLGRIYLLRYNNQIDPAGTAAVTWTPRKGLSIVGEMLAVDYNRSQLIQIGKPPRVTQLALRLSF